MEQNKKSGWQKLMGALAVLGAMVGAFALLYRIERRLRVLCHEAEQRLRVRQEPMTIEL